MAERSAEELAMLAVVEEAALEKRDWRAAMRWLEVNYPEKYKKATGHGGKREGAGNKAGNMQAPDRVKLRSVK